MRRIITTLAVLALGITIAAPATAPAAKVKKIATEVTVDGATQSGAPRAARLLGTILYFGAVESPAAACRKSRKVSITFKPDSGGKFKRIGYDYSDSEGNWALRLSFDNAVDVEGTLKARTPKRKLSKRKLCKADSSPGFHLIP